MATTKRKKNRDLCRVTTPMFRVSYPHVFKAQAPKDTDKKKFSITMLFPKDSDMTGIKEAIKQAKIAAFGPDKTEWPEGLQSPVQDGDGPQFVDEDGNRKEGYKGCWVIKATSNEDQKPTVVDQNVEPIVNQSDFYPGCYAIAHLLATDWEYMKKKGVMFILDHVQKAKDGKAFGGKKPVDQVFSKISGDDSDSSFDENEEQADF